MAKATKPKVGRPAVDEKKVSKTLAIKPSEHEGVIGLYGSLTKMYEQTAQKEVQQYLKKKKKKHP